MNSLDDLIMEILSESNKLPLDLGNLNLKREVNIPNKAEGIPI